MKMHQCFTLACCLAYVCMRMEPRRSQCIVAYGPPLHAQHLVIHPHFGVSKRKSQCKRPLECIHVASGQSRLELQLLNPVCQCQPHWPVDMPHSGPTWLCQCCETTIAADGPVAARRHVPAPGKQPGEARGRGLALHPGNRFRTPRRWPPTPLVMAAAASASDFSAVFTGHSVLVSVWLNQGGRRIR